MSTIRKDDDRGGSSAVWRLGWVVFVVSCGSPVTENDAGQQLVDGGQRAVDGGVLPQVDAGCPEMEQGDGGCLPLAFARVCDLSRFTVLQSGVTLDDAASLRMSDAIATHCSPPPATVMADTRDGGGGWLDSTGAPLVGRAEVFVAAGGSFTQPFVGWYERTGRSPVYESTTGELTSLSTRAGDVIFTEPLANLGPHLDYFVVEFVRSESTGPLSVIAYGFYAPGTAAAAWFFEHRVLPTASSTSWYVVRWNDVDGNALPGDADHFTILRSGP